MTFTLCRQVDRDCEFLEQERIMDYSLLVGIHFKEISHTGEPLSTEASVSNARTPAGNISNILRSLVQFLIFFPIELILKWGD